VRYADISVPTDAVVVHQAVATDRVFLSAAFDDTDPVPWFLGYQRVPVLPYPLIVKRTVAPCFRI
jgi:hypothetical protein